MATPVSSELLVHFLRSPPWLYLGSGIVTDMCTQHVAINCVLTSILLLGSVHQAQTVWIHLNLLLILPEQAFLPDDFVQV